MSSNVTVQCVAKTTNELPKYQTPGSAGADVRADLGEIKTDYLYNSSVEYNEDGTISGICIRPGGRALVGTGIYVSIPKGYELQVRPRSGLALKSGITVLNTPGTIDSDYRGEIGVILINHGTENFIVKQGDRIAQLVLSKVETMEFTTVESTEELGQTKRNGGFGHTNIA